MKVGVLGAVEASRQEDPVDLGTRKQRALIARLALAAGRPVSVDSIVDSLWPEGAPGGVAGTLQAYVSGLRRALEPDRPARAPATVLVTMAPGYALRLADDALDAARFERLISAAHRRLAVPDAGGAGPTAGVLARDLSEPALTAVLDDLDTALALWRGTPYVDLDDAPQAIAERARLEELRTMALEDRVVVHLARGEHATAAAEAEALLREHPLRERLWAFRALALTRAGRQAEALEVIREIRSLLDEELGLEPGPELRDLQAAILAQDPRLDWRPPEPAEPSPPADTRVPTGSSVPGSVPALPTPSDHAPDGADGGEPAQRHTASSSATTPPRPWGLVGRADELHSLTKLLTQASMGTPAFATIVGEPGIGKTRLCSELATVAVEEGATVLVGRCSQDDGAPPLWPWAAILRGLGAEIPVVADDDPGAPFRVREAIIGVLTEVARRRPLLVVLDDLHWADAASLRVLHLLAETAEPGGPEGPPPRLLVVATWRNHPAPTGPLAEVAEALARRHATRLDLEGLDDGDVAQLVSAVAHSTPSADQALALRQRTDGNPFFLVEYARLAKEGSDLARLVHEPEPPSAVTDVLVRRLDRLPAGTLATLRTAAVIGREFDLDTLAAALRADPDRVLDDLDPALAAGLLRDVGADRFRFAHALVRDAAYAGLAPSRRQRQHALVAAAVELAPGRESEVAHHWLAAGPAHADRAWPAAVAAAATASRLHAHEAGVELLRAALGVLPQDPGATPRDRYDVLLLLVESLRWGGDIDELLAAVEQAIVVADELGDVELLARAATGSGLGSLWLTTPYGVVFETIVAALRRCLDRLPAADGALRCRVMMSLALETYYGATIEERMALVDEALAMARRLDDDGLLLEGLQLAFTAIWRPASAPRRFELATEAQSLARRLGDERATVLATLQLAIVCGEQGRVEEMHRLAARARLDADRLRMNYALLVIAALELPWTTMAGRFEDAQALCAEVLSLDKQMSLAQGRDAVAASLLILLVWRGGLEEATPLLEGLANVSVLPIQAPVAAFLIRVGAVDAARQYLASSPPLLRDDNWYSMLNWSMAAEAGFALGLPDLAADAYARLAPFPGRVTSAGSANAFGPVDAFLALAAATVGERELAIRHADRAAELCEKWEIPLAAQWLRDKRDQGGF